MMEALLNGTTTSTTSTTTTTLAPIISGSGTGSKLVFREDGLRQPPDFTASNNLIIMIMGLSILIVPVVCFVLCMCRRAGLFGSIRNLKLTNFQGDGCKLPYSEFDSEHHEPEPKAAKVPIPKDVKVLIRSDNTAPGSPKYTANGESLCNIMKKTTKLKPSPSSTSLEFSTVDLDPTFVQLRTGDNSPLNYDNHEHYPPHS